MTYLAIIVLMSGNVVTLNNGHCLDMLHRWERGETVKVSLEINASVTEIWEVDEVACVPTTPAVRVAMR